MAVVVRRTGTEAIPLLVVVDRCAQSQRLRSPPRPPRTPAERSFQSPPFRGLLGAFAILAAACAPEEPSVRAATALTASGLVLIAVLVVPPQSDPGTVRVRPRTACRPSTRIDAPSVPVDRRCGWLGTVMVLVMQAGAPFWDSLVFAGIDDVDVEAVTAAFGTVEVMARGFPGRVGPRQSPARRLRLSTWAPTRSERRYVMGKENVDRAPVRCSISIITAESSLGSCLARRSGRAQPQVSESIALP